MKPAQTSLHSSPPALSPGPVRRTIYAEGSVRAALDRQCLVTGEWFVYDFETDFETYVKEVRALEKSKVDEI
jgi:hypothetical protein